MSKLLCALVSKLVVVVVFLSPREREREREMRLRGGGGKARYYEIMMMKRFTEPVSS